MDQEAISLKVELQHVVKGVVHRFCRKKGFQLQILRKNKKSVKFFPFFKTFYLFKTKLNVW